MNKEAALMIETTEAVIQSYRTLVNSVTDSQLDVCTQKYAYNSMVDVQYIHDKLVNGEVLSRSEVEGCIRCMDAFIKAFKPKDASIRDTVRRYTQLLTDANRV